MSPGPLRDWERRGFGSPPAECESKGIEFIFRCYSSTPRRDLVVGGRSVESVGSPLYGNCFFVPRLGLTTSIENASYSDRKRRWTWAYLEQQLNAWFFGNDYERVAMFRLNRGVRYQIGELGRKRERRLNTLTFSHASLCQRNGT